MTDDDRRIFIGGLRFATDESALSEYFQRWGPLSEVKIVRYPPPDSRSKGYGFISFESQAARDSCVGEGTHTIDGKTIEIRLSDSQKKHRVAGGQSTYEEAVADLDLEDVKFRRLFVGNIDHSWTEEVISDYFGHIGHVQECTVKKNAEGKPLGFAFMTFETSKCVDKIQQLRPHTIQGRRVETKRQVAKQNVGKPEAKLEVDRVWIGAPESEKGGKGHIGLGDSHSDEILETYFTQFGKVKKIQQLMWEDTKKKRGYGFVVFDDFDSVDKVVLSRVHLIEGIKIEVKKAIKDKDRLMGGGRNMVNNMGAMNMGMGNMMSMGGMGPAVNNMGYNMTDPGRATNGRKRGIERDFPSIKKAKIEIRDPESEIMRSIFVGNLNPKSEKADMEEYFAKFGEIVNVDLRKVPNSTRNRGFAFVVFAKSSDVDNVMAARPHKLGGTNIDCKRKTPRSEGVGMEERVTKVWIGKPDPEYMIRSYGLDDSTTDEVLTEYFERFGKVSHIHQFIWKDTNKKRGYGYITFDDADTVDKIVLLAIHEVAGVKLQCKKAISKEVQEAEQRKKMAMQTNSAINMMGATGNMNMISGGNSSGGSGNMMGMHGMGMSMNNMGQANNMQSMINQMQQPVGGGQMAHHHPNPPLPPQPAVSGQMHHHHTAGGYNAGGMDNTSNMKEMMNSMHSMMGTIKKETDKKGKVVGAVGEEPTEKMMGMMGNMMSLMNNMASMLHPNSTGKDTAAVPQKTGYGGGASGSGNVVGYGATGYGANQNAGSYGAAQNPGYGASQSSAGQGYDASNYGYGY